MSQTQQYYQQQQQHYQQYPTQYQQGEAGGWEDYAESETDTDGSYEQGGHEDSYWQQQHGAFGAPPPPQQPDANNQPAWTSWVDEAMRMPHAPPPPPPPASAPPLRGSRASLEREQNRQVLKSILDPNVPSSARPAQPQQQDGYFPQDAQLGRERSAKSTQGFKSYSGTYNAPVRSHSRTLAHAYAGTGTGTKGAAAGETRTTSPGFAPPLPAAPPPPHPAAVRNVMPPVNVALVESSHAALAAVHQAFWGRSRAAKDRIHWGFDRFKDERVASLLNQIYAKRDDVAVYGLQKFVQSREKGALFFNAGYQSSPAELTLDWLTYDELQGTMDKIIQESVVSCDPGLYTIVFVFLPSGTGNSVAIWRDKIEVPPTAREMYNRDVQIASSCLTKEAYVVHVDEIPPSSNGAAGNTASPPVIPPGKLKKSMSGKSASGNGVVPEDTGQPAKKKKKKWWNIFSR